MTGTSIGRDGLVLYRARPAVVVHTGDKLEIALEDGKTAKVRPKDVVLLHPGPAVLRDLKPLPGDIQAAWELLAGSATTLPELAELVYGAYTPATAWAAWQWVADGLYFGGEPAAIVAHTTQEVAQRQAGRAAKAAEADAWSGFLQRLQTRKFVAEDKRYLQEVAELALGRRDRSRVLSELGRGQTPEIAHALLLEVGYWDELVNPYPARMDVDTNVPSVVLTQLADEQRLDLTHLPAYAIDDEGARDPDDALSMDGDRLWVHVADAAALVLPDSPADVEARGRGANLYLPECTVPMLPAAATDLLGLGLSEVSPALSFGLRLDGHGLAVDCEIAPSWIRATRLSYEEADSRLDEPIFARLAAFAAESAARRHQDGAVSLDLPEVKIVVQSGRVQIRPLPALRSRAVVSEAMLLAGQAVARYAVERNISMPFTVQESGEALPAPQTLAGMFARRRSLRPSRQSTVPGPHTGLGLPCYVRVTSPLRRYLDLVAHQQLRAAVSGQPVLAEPAILERVAVAEAMASSVRRTEQLARQHWTLVYLQQNPGWSGTGVVVESFGARATVLIPALAWETRLHLRHELPLDSVVSVAVNGVNLPNLHAFFRVL